MLPDVGATEYLVIAIVALIVVGPKDLPVLLKKLGQFLAKLRGMASEFRASFDEMARQSELDELRKEVEAMRSGQLTDMAAKAADLKTTQMHLHHAVNCLVGPGGKGFDASATDNGDHNGMGGHGLGSMRKRAEALGGTYEINSQKDQGTTVTLRVPVSGHRQKKVSWKRLLPK